MTGSEKQQRTSSRRTIGLAQHAPQEPISAIVYLKKAAEGDEDMI